MNTLNILVVLIYIFKEMYANMYPYTNGMDIYSYVGRIKHDQDRISLKIDLQSRSHNRTGEGIATASLIHVHTVKRDVE